MIIDLNTNDTISPNQYDVCIVGAGAAGITIAKEMDEFGVSSLVSA